MIQYLNTVNSTDSLALEWKLTGINDVICIVQELESQTY